MKNKEQSSIENAIFSVNLLMLLFNVMLLVLTLGIFKGMYITYFKRLNAYIDILWLAVSFWLSEQLISISFRHKMEINVAQDYDKFEKFLKELGLLFVCGIFLLFLRLTYFLKLFDSIAPLITIIMQIFKDILYFIVILFMITFAVACCLSILAQNQINFDQIDKQDVSQIEYATISSAIVYVGSMILGDPVSTDSFHLGLESQKTYLLIVYYVSSFIIMVHLLNMLIAIMGNTFSQHN